MHGINYGQLSTGIVNTLTRRDEWEWMDTDCNPLELIEELREPCYQDNETKINPALDFIKKLKKMTNVTQDGDNKEVSKFVEESRMQYEVIKSSGIHLRSEKLIKYTINKEFPNRSYTTYTAMCKEEAKAIPDAADNIVIATMIVEGSNKKGHHNLAGVLLRDHFSLGTDMYIHPHLQGPPITAQSVQVNCWQEEQQELKHKL